jgi:hypothetical protein
MTQRAEAMQEQQEAHHFWALVLTILAVALIAGYGVFIGIYATHLPHAVGSGTDVMGAYYENVTIKWDHLVIEIDGDFDMGDYRWEITRDPGNETVRDGMQGKDDGETITVADLGPDKYGVFVDPTGVNSAHAYDVTLREYYITPGTIKAVSLAALFFLAVLALCLWYGLLSKDTERFREEYRLANIAVALAMVLSVAVAVVPFI